MQDGFQLSGHVHIAHTVIRRIIGSTREGAFFYNYVEGRRKDD